MNLLLDIAFVWAIVGLLRRPPRVPSDTVATRSEPAGTEPVPTPTADVASAAPAIPEVTAARGESPEEIGTPPVSEAVSLEEALRHALGSLPTQNPTALANPSTARAAPPAVERERSSDAAAWAARPLYGVGGLRLAPPPSAETETPAHRVLRLGDAPESPIH